MKIVTEYLLIGVCVLSLLCAISAEILVDACRSHHMSVLVGSAVIVLLWPVLILMFVILFAREITRRRRP